MNTDLSPSLRARDFLAGYRQKEANKKIVLGQLWQGAKNLFNRMGGSKKIPKVGPIISGVPAPVTGPGMGLKHLNRPGHTPPPPGPRSNADVLRDILPLATGAGFTGYHLSEGEPLSTSLIAGTGAGVLTSRQLWNRLAIPKGPVKHKYGPKKLSRSGSGIPTSTGEKTWGITTTPQRDNMGIRYALGVGTPAAMLGAPQLSRTLMGVREDINDTTSSLAESFSDATTAFKEEIAPTVSAALRGERVKNPETGEWRYEGGLAPALQQKLDTGGVAALVSPAATKTIENLEATTEGLAALATSVAGTLDKVSEAIATGADFAVANPRKVLALGGMYMLAAGGITGLIVWLRERNRRRTAEEQDKRHARQQKKMMKMVLDAQEEKEEEE